MKQKVYISAPGLFTPLGIGALHNFSEIKSGKSGIRYHKNASISSEPFYAAMIPNSVVDATFNKLGNPNVFTKLEKMMLVAATETIKKSLANISERTLLLVATTKGNVDTLSNKSNFGNSRAYLPELAQTVADFLEIKTTPVVVSNACVSGILAVAVAKKLVAYGVYDNVLIVSGDLISQFTFSGFNSFQALSDMPCKPYSKNRNGITIGEAAASVYISKVKPNKNAIEIVGDGSCNDANHISGPSRTGDGLLKSVEAALEEAALTPEQIDFISAHGTATMYNDEMEAMAFNRAHLQHTPLHSLKGVFGHTLGASGLLEAIIAMEMMNQETLLPSVGFDALGVSQPLQIIEKLKKQTIKTCLKTASGFGGCNTAVLFKKVS
ncbi:beta-ketoacyl synthase [Rasiella rasia]|uniref:Nodulation protein E n=1 Tax=Rasiella rasia TaxID=2744027 RepID=A0A6G6GNI2_9FLAO|nr:beta-ketoacyl synthase N-terminal-like domain-containing protein [Rasiella rasia]QIE60112.1 beta-ketoacyl synthase [Rasiella rasia]